MLQMLLAAFIVVCSAAYVLWALLLPAALRRRVALALLRRRWPAALSAWLQRLAQPSTGCSCEGCDQRPAPARPGGTLQPVHWIPRRKR